MDPYDEKVFRFWLGTTFFKMFPLRKRFLCILFYLQEFQIKTQLMTNTLHQKQVQQDYITVQEMNGFYGYGQLFS